jgi:N6-L-threonylcarbamoyladenine synthase
LKKISLGIDTSCYTTSLVAIDQNNHILFEDRISLEVKDGHLGLRQSQAFFQHIRNLPILYEKCLNVIDPANIGSVCVSSQPRNVKDSYMPVFTAGVNLGKIMAKSLKCQYLEISHQENHLLAVAFDHLLPETFIGVHISGGTSEILKVNNKERMFSEIIGKSLDLSFGQLIDRIGLYMGLAFPCGKKLDQLRTDPKNRYQLKLSIKELSFNLSGFENKLKGFYDQDHDLSKVSNTLFYYLALILSQVLKEALRDSNLETVVLSGGVSANSYLREFLVKTIDACVIFPEIPYATDHALGNAYYGSRVLNDET